MNEEIYSIEARSYSIPGVPASHNFWVLLDASGNVISEMHGLATERGPNGNIVPIGTDDDNYSLRVYRFDHTNTLGTEYLDNYTLVESGQDTRIVFTSSKDVVLDRWDDATRAISYLNSLDLDYPAYGFNIFSDTVNSNSTFRTLGEIMRVPIIDFQDVVEPGLDNRMIPSDMINKFILLNDIYGISDEQYAIAMLNEDLNGMTITLEDGSTIYLATNSLDGLGNVISSTTILPSGLEDASSSYFFNQNGDFIGNIQSFDPDGVLLNSIGSDGTSALLEQFQNILTDDALLVSGIYTSPYAYDDSLFSDYLFYSQDDRHNINWLELANVANGIDTSVGNYDDWIANSGVFGDSYDYFMLDNYTYLNNYTFDSTWTFDDYLSNYSYDANTGFTYNYDLDYSYDDYGSYDYYGYDSFDYFFYPVVLDLDGDGVEITSVLESKAWFDVEGDGVKHQTGWVGADDGLLVYDENGDGKITTAREVAFATRTTADDTDMEALRAEFDNNKDGKLDSADENFDKFYIWQDKDSDGESDDGELLTLTQTGIASINLVGASINSYAIDGNKISAFTSYIRADGTIGMGADIALGYDSNGYMTTSQNGYMTVKQMGSSDIYAMATSATPLIIDLAINNLAGAIGNDGNDTFDATGKQTAVVLEGGSGNDWLKGGTGSDAIYGGDGHDTIIIDDGDNLSNINGGSGFDTLIYEGNSDLNINMDALEVESIYSGDGNDFILGSMNSDILEGRHGNDILNGSSGDDVYVYHEGDGIDTIKEYASCNGFKAILVEPYASNPTIIKGFNDGIAFLSEHGEPVGSETYSFILSQFALNSRTWKYIEAVVEINAGNDTIQFGNGIDIFDLNLQKIGDDLIIKIDSNDMITIKDFTNSNRTIENIRFSDGSTYKLDGLVIGTEENDSLVGDDNDNTFVSGSGIDTMQGGIGNDTYYIDSDNDVVIENANEGTDTLISSITYTLSANVENIQLLGTAAINATGNMLNNVLTGNSANNILYGKAGDDTINGGAGDDTIKGDTGNDTICGEDGNDIICGNGGKDVLEGGAGEDIFVFDTQFFTQIKIFSQNIIKSNGNVDTITDFSHNDDTIDLENSIFTKLTNTGVLNSNYFKITSDGKAKDSNDYIIYNSKTGELSYDADGNGFGVAVVFATLSNKPIDLTYSDFVVV
ncbi:MAG: calcium-binding protein [Sulfurovaceae bacterium]|nr:calcium-binding protein [Sulfurovaceae bacterium]